MPFGRLLGPPQVVLGASESRKACLFFFSKIICCANAGFRCFETLDGLLWVHLGASKANLGPNLAPRSSPKSIWKLFKGMRQATRNPRAHKETLCPCSTPKSLLGGPGLSQDAMALPGSHKASKDAPVLQGRPKASWEGLGRPRAP